MDAPLESLLNAATQSLPGVEARIAQGDRPGSTSWLVLNRAGRQVAVELRPEAGFGLYLEGSPAGAQAPTEVFIDPAALLDRICQYLGPWPQDASAARMP